HFRAAQMYESLVKESHLFRQRSLIPVTVMRESNSEHRQILEASSPATARPRGRPAKSIICAVRAAGSPLWAAEPAASAAWRRAATGDQRHAFDLSKDGRTGHQAEALLRLAGDARNDLRAGTPRPLGAPRCSPARLPDRGDRPRPPRGQDVDNGRIARRLACEAHVRGADADAPPGAGGAVIAGHIERAAGDGQGGQSVACTEAGDRGLERNAGVGGASWARTALPLCWAFGRLTDANRRPPLRPRP